MPFRGKRSNRPKTNKTRKNRKPTKKVSAPVKTYVKSIVSRSLEKRENITTGLNVSIQSATTSTAPVYINMFPNLTQGDGQGQRQGNEVRIKRAVIKGRVNLLPFATLQNNYQSPSLVKMWLCRRKRASYDIKVPVLSDFNQFFGSGSSATGFQANPLDMFAPHNKDYWDVLSTRNFQLGNATGPAYTAGAITSPSSHVSVPYTFYFDKYLGKLMYNDATTNYPTNKELYLVFQAVFADGTSSSLTAQIETHYVMEFEYTTA